ncbi:MAG: hypothetical protein KKE17_06280 [Proteobacteria bacterium]|nr:hypothetical protein [Pseudomonadota bacterium]MBU1709595.1 hypothetical protein [Pseudomonadota bacterium]
MEEDKKIIRIFVESPASTVITCPFCDKFRTTSVTRFKNIQGTIKVKCSCKKEFFIKLDFVRLRQQLTSLNGEFVNLTRNYARGKIQNIHVTKKSITFNTTSFTTVQRGDKLKIDFTLEKPTHNKVQKNAIVRLVRGNHVECYFVDNSGFGREIDSFIPRS